jgi:3-oxoadipate enol-lactonase
MPKTKSGLHYQIDDIRPPWRKTQAKRGRPVVFHHGVAANLHMFSKWVGIVAEHHPIVRFDMRGFGESEIPPKDFAWSIDALVADIFEVADAAFGAEQVHLVGESIGGTATLLAALRHPGRVLSATISNTPIKGAGLGYVRGWQEEIERIGIKGWSAKLMHQRFVPGAISEEQWVWLQGVQDTSPAHAVLGLGIALAEGDFRTGLEQFSQPLLALMPDQSPYVPVAQAAELTQIVKQTELAVFRGARHGLPLSHGPECARLLVDFLDRVERGVAPARRDVKFS